MTRIDLPDEQTIWKQQPESEHGEPYYEGREDRCRCMAGYRAKRPYRRKEKRHCASCQAPRPIVDGPDPCLGTLPNVLYACCGHGSRPIAYVVVDYSDRIEIFRGDKGIAKMRELGGNPPNPVTDEIWYGHNRTWPKD